MAEDDTFDDFEPEAQQQVAAARAVNNEAREKAVLAALEERRIAFVRVFTLPGAASATDQRIVMDELKRFCNGGKTPWADDARLHALITGRNEVWTRIEQHTKLTLSDLFEILNGGKN